MRFCYAVTLIASIIAALVAVGGNAAATGAPQQAAASAIALAIAVIPYVFSRCVEKFGSSAVDELRELRALLTPPPPAERNPPAPRRVTP